MKLQLLLICAAALLPVLSRAQTFHVDIDRNHDRDQRDSEHDHYDHLYHRRHHHEHGYWRTRREWDSDHRVWVIRREYVEPDEANANPENENG
jgi:hypothetical protein